MRFTKSSALALALCIAAAPAAFAREESPSSCVAAESQVSSALGGTQQNADAARHEKALGLQYCHAGYYRQGVGHYAKAMELLGTKLAQS